MNGGEERSRGRKQSQPLGTAAAPGREPTHASKAPAPGAPPHNGRAETTSRRPNPGKPTQPAMAGGQATWAGDQMTRGQDAEGGQGLLLHTANLRIDGFVHGFIKMSPCDAESVFPGAILVHVGFTSMFWNPRSTSVMFHRVTCSRSTRETLIRTYPVVRTDPILWRALVYLLFGARFDQSSGRLKLDERALEWIAGYPIYMGRWTQRDRFCTREEALIYIRDGILPELRWTQYGEGRPRAVLRTGLSRRLRWIVRRELARDIRLVKDRVYLVDGLLYRPDTRAADRRAVLLEATASLPNAASATSRYILERMNHEEDRPFGGFTKILVNAPDAIRVARSYHPKRRSSSQKRSTARLPKASRAVRSPGHRQRLKERLRYRRALLLLLRVIQEMPQPFYRPSRETNTDRVFGVRPSLLDVPGDVRAALTRPAKWVELDLRSAHMAIASAVWGIPSLAALVASPGGIWDTLFVQLGIPNALPDARRKRIKEVLKGALYATVFGMPVTSLKAMVTTGMNLIGESVRGQDFTDTPIIQQVLTGRAAFYTAMRNGAVVLPPTGIFIDPGRKVEEQMATIAQSYEAVLMYPILRYEQEEIDRARATGQQPDFRIMLWQHDGCSVRFNKRKATHIEGMQAAVDAVAAQYAIPTRLEVKG